MWRRMWLFCYDMRLAVPKMRAGILLSQETKLAGAIRCRHSNTQAGSEFEITTLQKPFGSHDWNLLIHNA